MPRCKKFSSSERVLNFPGITFHFTCFSAAPSVFLKSFFFSGQVRKMKMKGILVLLCMTVTCGAQKWKQETSRWDPKGQGRHGLSTIMKNVSIQKHSNKNVFRFKLRAACTYKYTFVFSRRYQWKDLLQPDPGAGQLEICDCNPSERPADQ